MSSRATPARPSALWRAPDTDSGARIKRYIVTPYRNGTAQRARELRATTTTQSITGLTNGATYTFTSAAKNSAGVGYPSLRTKPIVVHA